MQMESSFERVFRQERAAEQCQCQSCCWAPGQGKQQVKSPEQGGGIIQKVEQNEVYRYRREAAAPLCVQKVWGLFSAESAQSLLVQLSWTWS